MFRQNTHKINLEIYMLKRAGDAVCRGGSDQEFSERTWDFLNMIFMALHGNNLASSQLPDLTFQTTNYKHGGLAPGRYTWEAEAGGQWQIQGHSVIDSELQTSQGLSERPCLKTNQQTSLANS